MGRTVRDNTKQAAPSKRRDRKAVPKKRGHNVSLPIMKQQDSGGKDKRTIRPSKNARRRAIVLGAVQVLILLHIGVWLLSRQFGWFDGYTLTPIEPSESMEFSKQGIINAGLIFFALALASTLVLGRWFCGWGCHIVMLQDLCGWIMKKMGIRPRPFRSRLLIYVPLLLAIYMFVLPAVHRWALVPLDRTMAASWGPDHVVVQTVRWTSGALGFPLPINLPDWRAQAHLTTDGFWDTFVGPLMAIPFLLVCGFATVYFLGAKGFCTYGCPYGGFFAPLDKYAPARIRVTDACEQCGHCTAVCTSNVRVHDEVREYGMVVDPGCMKCMDCVSVCPNDALYFGWGKPAVLKGAPKNQAPKRKYDLTANEELALAGVFFGTFIGVRGVYGLVPMLMAVGIAGCVAFLVWKAWRLIRDKSVNLHRYRLKYKGAMTRSGWVFALLTLVAALLVIHSSVVRAAFSMADRHAARAAVAPEIIFAEDRPPLPEEVRDHADRAIGLYRFISSVPDGGIALLRSSWQTEIDYRMARMYTCKRDFDSARALLQRVIDRDGVSDRFASSLAWTLRGAGQDERADAYYRELLVEHRDLPDMLADYVNWCLQRGEPDAAFTVCRSRLERFQDDPPTLQWSARLLIEGGRFGDAMPLLQRLIDVQPDNAGAHARLAGLLLVGGDAERAETVLRRGLRHSPDSPALNARLAELLQAMGRVAEAQQYAERAQQSAPSRSTGGH